MTKISVKRNVCYPFSSTVEAIERFHRESDHRVGPFARFRTVVECEIAETRDYTDATRIHEALVLQWRGHSIFPIPRFRGFITVRPNAPATEVHIEGSYLPPLGLFGRIFDFFIGRYIARRTLERFMDSISCFIEQEHQRSEP